MPSLLVPLVAIEAESMYVIAPVVCDFAPSLTLTDGIPEAMYSLSSR